MKHHFEFSPEVQHNHEKYICFAWTLTRNKRIAFDWLNGRERKLISPCLLHFINIFHYFENSETFSIHFVYVCFISYSFVRCYEFAIHSFIFAKKLLHLMMWWCIIRVASSTKQKLDYNLLSFVRTSTTFRLFGIGLLSMRYAFFCLHAIIYGLMLGSYYA